jgi:hypothetical protein
MKFQNETTINSSTFRKLNRQRNNFFLNKFDMNLQPAMSRKFIKYFIYFLLTGGSFTAANAQVGLCPSNLDF